MEGQQQAWDAGPVRIFTSEQARQRERTARHIASGENRERMERRQAAKLGLSLERYRELKALRSIFVALRRASRRSPLITKECEECGGLFTQTRPTQKLCGEQCRAKRQSRRTSKTIMRRYHSDPEFAAKVQARASARRAERLGLGSREITISYLLERDGWKCGICHRKIRSFKQASLDHIIPISLGGRHELTNVQAAHRKCNYSKGNRGGGDQYRLFG